SAVFQAAGIDGAALLPHLPDDFLGRIDFENRLSLFGAGDERVAVFQPLDAGRPAREAAISPEFLAEVVVFDDRFFLVRANEAVAIGQALAGPGLRADRFLPEFLSRQVEFDEQTLSVVANQEPPQQPRPVLEG